MQLKDVLALVLYSRFHLLYLPYRAALGIPVGGLVLLYSVAESFLFFRLLPDRSVFCDVASSGRGMVDATATDDEFVGIAATDSRPTAPTLVVSWVVSVSSFSVNDCCTTF
jgi:hypothetical protein